MTLTFKPLLLKAISDVHLAFFQKDLPDTVAIYFHEIETWQVPRLDEALAFFAREGFRTVSPGDLATPAKPGEKRLFVSFDDNFRGWHAILPLLERHRVRCTFYVNTGLMRDVADASSIADYFARIRYGGADTTLSRAEIREMHAAGHNIGCHTHTHPVLSRLPRDRWDAEIVRCKGEVEDLTGAAATDFSFPFGMRRHFSSELRDYCAEVGFRTVATGLSGLQHVSRVDPLSTHRTKWCLDSSLEDNLARLRVHSPFYAGLMGRCPVGGLNWLAAPLPFVW